MYGHNAAREQIFSALKDGIIRGTLTVEDGDKTFVFGSPPGLTVTLRVHKPDMWTRVLISGDLGGTLALHGFTWCSLRPVILDPVVSEAYMEGDFQVSSLKDLLNVGST